MKKLVGIVTGVVCFTLGATAIAIMVTCLQVERLGDRVVNAIEKREQRKTKKTEIIEVEENLES